MADEAGKVGEAYLEIRYKEAADAAKQLEQSAARDLDPAAARLGDRFGTILGKGVGLALNPRVQAGVGAASALLVKFAGDQATAQDRLKSAFTQTGKNLDLYTRQIKAAVQAGEKLGQDQGRTKNLLADLTLGLGSAGRALKTRQLALDLAAGKNLNDSAAAALVVRLVQGQKSAFDSLGVSVRDVTKAQSDLRTAQRGYATSGDRAARAQQQFNDKLQVYRATTKPTLTQQLALRRSYEVLTDAQKQNVTSAERVRDAQRDVRLASRSVSEGLTEVGQRFTGQASAGADSFLGKLSALGAQARDTGGDLVNKVGGAITTVGPLLFGIGVTAQTVAGAFGILRNAQVVSAAEGAAATEAGAVRTIRALEAEGATAIATGAKIRAAIGLAGTLGAVVAGGFLLKGAADAGFSSLAGGVKNKSQAGLSGSDRAVVDQLDKILNSTGKLNRPKGALDLFNQAVSRTGGGIKSTTLKDRDAARTFLAKFGGGGKDVQGLLNYLDSIPGSIGFLDPKSRNSRGRLADALNSDDPKTAARAAQAVIQSKKIGASVGKAAGDATLQEFLNSIGGGPVATGGGGGGRKRGLGGAVASSLNEARQPAIDAARKLAMSIGAEFAKANAKLRADTAASLSLQRQTADRFKQGTTISDFLQGRANTPSLNTFGDRAGGTGRSGTGDLLGFLKGKRDRLIRFANDLTILRRRGLSPVLLAQIADLGAEEGDAVARTLIADSTQIGGLNTAQRQIDRASQGVGKAIADSQFARQIAGDKANADRIEKKLEQIRKELAAAQRQPKTIKVDARKAGATEKQSATATARAVSLAMKGM